MSRLKTDHGYVWVKTMNNPQGPHALVSEFIGFELAHWLRLKTPRFLVHDFGDQSQVILMANGQRGAPGPSFVTFELDVREWDGTHKDLAENVENNWDVVGLIILDTWLRNIDRYAPFRKPPRHNIANVFFASRDGANKRHLVALDHSEALRVGESQLHRSICSIDRIKDDRIFGMFPEFVPFIVPEHKQRFLQRLASFEKAHARQLVDAIPAPWDVSTELRDAIASFLYERARFLCTFAAAAISGPPQQLDMLRLFEGTGHG